MKALKTRPSILVLILVFGLVFFRCKEKTPGPEISTLPPLSSSGANTFGFIVNNEIWIPSDEENLNPSYSLVQTRYDPEKGKLVINAVKFKRWNTRIYRDKAVLVLNDIFTEGSYFMLGEPVQGIMTDDPSYWYRAIDESKKLESPTLLTEGYLTGGFIYDYGDIFNYSSTGIVNGEAFPLSVEIIKLDTINKICSGTFKCSPNLFFDFPNENPVKVSMSVVEGRFDVSY